MWLNNHSAFYGFLVLFLFFTVSDFKVLLMCMEKIEIHQCVQGSQTSGPSIKYMNLFALLSNKNLSRHQKKKQAKNTKAPLIPLVQWSKASEANFGNVLIKFNIVYSYIWWDLVY